MRELRSKIRQRENHARECKEKRHSSSRQNRDNSAKIQISHLNFAYPDGKKILDDICLSVEKGQIIGITGAVACGKSTLGKVFLCEYPYEGQIFVDGTDLQAMDAADRTKRIGYLGHDPELFLTVWKIIFCSVTKKRQTIT